MSFIKIKDYPQHRQVCLTMPSGLPPTSTRGHLTDGPKTNHALTFNMDHSSGATQNHLGRNLMEIKGFLDHLNIDPSQKDFWIVRIGEAILNFKNNVELEKNRKPSETQYLALQIQNFSRSIKRRSKISTLDRRWHQLPSEANIFINFQLKSVSKQFIDFGDLDLTIDADQKLLFEATNRAKKWVQKKRGYSHDYPTLDLVRAISHIYQSATGKKPGLSSKEDTRDPDYMTPFEKVLMASLSSAGIDISLDGTRSLYRSIAQNKPIR